MVKQAKVVANKLAKSVQSNRILMIVCVFIVMGLAVALINYLQNKTLERFTQQVVDLSDLSELTTAEHGNDHKDCAHQNEDGRRHFCGHCHTPGCAEAHTQFTTKYQSETGKAYSNNTGYYIDDTTRGLRGIDQISAPPGNSD